jgi:hypothetical protein
MKIWAKTEEFKEGKFLVVRRDGTIPHWPHFVLGARDPAAIIALLAYASAADELGYDPEYGESIRELAEDFIDYQNKHGQGDPPAAPHRHDNHNVIEAMRGKPSLIAVIRDPPAAPTP